MILNCLEICAGAGGQSLGLEQAGFEHLAAIELDPDAARTLRANRPGWDVIEHDVNWFDAFGYRGQVDLFAGGVPCPPFTIAGLQAGGDDDRDLFPEALRLVWECEPAAIMLENVPGLAQPKFGDYRTRIVRYLAYLGYKADWRIVNACDHEVPQLRPRFILVAMRPAVFRHFAWPFPSGPPPTVGEALRDFMAAGGWTGADQWAKQADDVGPTLVGGSRKHGGADLGPTRARAAWAKLGVDGRSLADAPPPADAPAGHMPKLTRDMAAVVQGFPPNWVFTGRKTASYRQVGNAFPPPVARAVAARIRTALETSQATPAAPDEQGASR